MSNLNKWTKAALVLLIAGVILFGVCFASVGFDWNRLTTRKYVTNVYDGLSGDFRRIVFDTDTARIVLKPAENGACSVTCFEEEKCTHDVTVQDGVLSIRTVDTRKWYDHIGLSFQTPEITVLLPQSAYDALTVSTHTGDVLIPASFRFGAVEIQGSSASVECLANVDADLSIGVTTGSITLADLSAQNVYLSATTGHIRADRVVSGGDFTADVRTGSVTLTDVTCVRLSSDGSTGWIALKNVTAGQELRVERSTGSVSFDRCDAASIFVKTSTGNVSGTLLRGMEFETHTHTGSVRVPANTLNGGKCEISTSTGNISIEVP